MKTLTGWEWRCWHWLPHVSGVFAPDDSGEFTIPCPGEWEFCWLGLHVFHVRKPGGTNAAENK